MIFWGEGGGEGEAELNSKLKNVLYKYLARAYKGKE